MKFDGLCNYCTYWIKFILKRDTKKLFSFIADNNNNSTIIVIYNDKLYYKSNAIIKILENINFPFTLLLLIRIFPKLFRDILYKIFSNNRYLFGKRNQCFIPRDHKF